MDKETNVMPTESIFIDVKYDPDTKRYMYILDSFCELDVPDMVKQQEIQKDYILRKSTSEIIRNV